MTNMLVERHDFGYTLKAEEEDFYEREEMLILAVWALGDMDCSLFGEEYCLGNALGMAIDLFDFYTGKIVRFPYVEAESLKEGKTITLYSHEMNEWEHKKYEELIASGEL